MLIEFVMRERGRSQGWLLVLVLHNCMDSGFVDRELVEKGAMFNGAALEWVYSASHEFSF